MKDTKNKEKWLNDSLYREKVIKELERSGKINKMSSREFAVIVGKGAEGRQKGGKRT